MVKTGMMVSVDEYVLHHGAFRKWLGKVAKRVSAYRGAAYADEVLPEAELAPQEAGSVRIKRGLCGLQRSGGPHVPRAAKPRITCIPPTASV